VFGLLPLPLPLPLKLGASTASASCFRFRFRIPASNSFTKKGIQALGTWILGMDIRKVPKLRVTNLRNAWI